VPERETQFGPEPVVWHAYGEEREREWEPSTQPTPKPTGVGQLQEEIDAAQTELHEFEELHRELEADYEAMIAQHPADEESAAEALDATLRELDADMEDLRQDLKHMKILQRRANAPRATLVPHASGHSGSAAGSRPRASPFVCGSSPRTRKSG